MGSGRRFCAAALVLIAAAAVLLLDVSASGPLTHLDQAVSTSLHVWFGRLPWAAGAAAAVSFAGSSTLGVPLVLGLVA